MKLPFDAHVMYGWNEGLKQWHMTAIIPVNFTNRQTDALKTIAREVTQLACGQVEPCFFAKGKTIPLFLEDGGSEFKSAVFKAVKMLESGDPEEAVSALEIALKQPINMDVRKLVEKAKDEATHGSVQEAENLLDLVWGKI